MKETRLARLPHAQATPEMRERPGRTGCRRPNGLSCLCLFRCGRSGRRWRLVRCPCCLLARVRVLQLALRCLLRNGQCEDEGRAHTWLALCPDAPAMLVDDGGRDGKPQTCTGGRPPAGPGKIDVFDAIELRKDGFELMGRDADPLVSDAHLPGAIRREHVRLDRDGAAPWRGLERVFDQG